MACQDLTRHNVCPARGGTGMRADQPRRRADRPHSSTSAPGRRSPCAAPGPCGATLITFVDNHADGLEPTESELVPVPTLDAIPEPGDQELAAQAAEPEATEVAVVATATPTAPATATADPEEEPAEVVDEESLDVEDSTRLYLREIARVPLLSAEEEVVLAKSIELGRPRHRRSPGRRSSTSTSGPSTTRSRRPGRRTPTYRLPFADDAHRIVRDALADDGAMDLLVTAPKFGLTESIAAAEGEAARAPREGPQPPGDLQRAARHRVVHDAVRLDQRRRPTHRSSVTRSRSSRCATWARDEVAIPAVRRWIEAGNERRARSPR